MAYIENLDAQQLFGLIKLKFGESNISLKTIKSTNASVCVCVWQSTQMSNLIHYCQQTHKNVTTPLCHYCS